MLTVDFDRTPLRAGTTVLDVGAGGGRHSFEAFRRGSWVVACDLDQQLLRQALGTMAAMADEGEAPATARAAGVQADARRLPFASGSLDIVVAAEVLEHIADDQRAMTEIARVLRPTGCLAVSVPRFLPERICWAISEEYHSNPGGHLRIYTEEVLRHRLVAAGFQLVERHHAHALHSPYWWLKCVAGPRNEDAWLPRLYHRFLVWEIVRRPRAIRLLERALNPLLGKSVVLYLRKPARPRDDAA